MKRILTTICAAVASTAVTAVFTPASEAAFVEPTTWVRGTGGATYQHWDIFTTTTDATPDVIGSTNAYGTATLTETTGALITSGGNIYGLNEASNFTVDLPTLVVTSPAPDHNATVIVQTLIEGTEIDIDSVLVNGLAATDYVELSRGASASGFGGTAVESWFIFNVPFAAFGNGLSNEDVTDLTLTFAATDAHMSLDQLAVDVSISPYGFLPEPTPVVPEPASLAMLSAGALLITRRRRQA